ncbi:MAG: hypothetical protein EHM13_08510 [Acidobacteria bacterium]|nr:MAG: hypothetical protein EHM13_08510 [Acidobacteriota bacterium]
MVLSAMKRQAVLDRDASGAACIHPAARWGAGLVGLLASLVLLAPAHPSAQGTRFPRVYKDVAVTVLDEWVADVDLSADGTRLTYSRRDPRDWYLDIWSTRPSGREKACLTCDLPRPTKHRGAPAWHPSGDLLVFSAEIDDVRTRKADRLAEPGTALNTNLWALAPEPAPGRAVALTGHATDYKDAKGVLAPAVSRDGKRIAWAGPVDRTKVGKGYEWGKWAIFLADLEVEDGVPSVRNVQVLQPGEQQSFYQVDDWSRDGRRLLISANAEPGKGVASLDIHEYDFDTERMRRLTETSDWDYHAHYSPDGRQIYWSSSRDLQARFQSVEGLNWRRDIRTELWVMNRDGSDPRRLTYFNQAGHRDRTWFRSRVFRTSRVFVTDNVCLLDGTRVAAVLGYEASGGQMGGVLAILNLDR